MHDTSPTRQKGDEGTCVVLTENSSSPTLGQSKGSDEGERKSSANRLLRNSDNKSVEWSARCSCPDILANRTFLAMSIYLLLTMTSFISISPKRKILAIL